MPLLLKDNWVRAMRDARWEMGRRKSNQTSVKFTQTRNSIEIQIHLPPDPTRNQHLIFQPAPPPLPPSRNNALIQKSRVDSPLTLLTCKCYLFYKLSPGYTPPLYGFSDS